MATKDHPQHKKNELFKLYKVLAIDQEHWGRALHTVRLLNCPLMWKARRQVGLRSESRKGCTKALVRLATRTRRRMANLPGRFRNHVMRGPLRLVENHSLSSTQRGAPVTYLRLEFSLGN